MTAITDLRRTLSAIERRLAHSGVTTAQYLVLATVASNEGCSQHAVTIATGMDRTTTSGVVRGMVRNRWLKRVQLKHDLRSRHLHMTPAGRARYERAKRTADDIERCLNGSQAGLKTALEKLIVVT
jgi:DNA-binding MarR family transcriptional regulator